MISLHWHTCRLLSRVKESIVDDKTRIVKEPQGSLISLRKRCYIELIGYIIQLIRVKRFIRLTILNMDKGVNNLGSL